MIEIRRVQIRDAVARNEWRQVKPQEVIYIVIHNHRRIDSFIHYRNARRCVKRLKI